LRRSVRAPPRWACRGGPSAHHYHSALKQVLNYAAAYGVTENVASKVENPAPKRGEVQTFGSWDEVEAVAAELLPRHRAIPVFCAGTGLRPEEWIALERRDVDRRAGVVVVERSFSGGRAKPYARTERSRRRVVNLACEGSLGAGLKSVPFDHARQIPATCCVFCSPGG
jgi:integrase